MLVSSPLNFRRRVADAAGIMHRHRCQGNDRYIMETDLLRPIDVVEVSAAYTMPAWPPTHLHALTKFSSFCLQRTMCYRFHVKVVTHKHFVFLVRHETILRQ